MKIYSLSPNLKLSVHPPQMSKFVRGGIFVSLTLCIQGWSMFESYFQGWNISHPPCPVVEHVSPSMSSGTCLASTTRVGTVLDYYPWMTSCFLDTLLPVVLSGHKIRTVSLLPLNRIHAPSRQ